MKTVAVKRTKHTMDATGQSLGRLATRVAILLRGKHKANFAPYRDEGDAVTVINAAQVVLTGKKTVQKVYRHHSFHPGGLKEVPYLRKRALAPHQIIEHAVRGMLPRTKMRDELMKRLTVKQ